MVDSWLCAASAEWPWPTVVWFLPSFWSDGVSGSLSTIKHRYQITSFSVWAAWNRSEDLMWIYVVFLGVCIGTLIMFALEYFDVVHFLPKPSAHPVSAF